MARLESARKMGYYPCPPLTLRLLQQFLYASATTPSLHLLDPCSGAGMALATLAESLKRRDGVRILTYGVELHAERATESANVLKHALQCSCFDLTCTKESMGLLFLNPPYDWDTATKTCSRRLETSFYKETIEYLAPKGILVFLLPINSVDIGLCRSLAYRFENLAVFRIPEEEYKVFHQVLVIGVRKHKPALDDSAAHSFLLALHNALWLDQVKPIQYEIPSTVGPKLFREIHPTPQQAVAELNQSPLHHEINQILAPQPTVSTLNPLMPLSIGHLSCVLTAGIINGLVQRSGKKILVKGFTRQISETTEESTANQGELKRTEIRKTQVAVRFFDEDGVLYNVT